MEALKRRAEADGVTIDEAANHVIQIGLREASWDTFLTKGQA